MKSKIALFLIPLLLALQSISVAQDTVPITGQIMQAFGDFTPPDPTGVEIPAANRQVLIFKVMFK